MKDISMAEIITACATVGFLLFSVFTHYSLKKTAENKSETYHHKLKLKLLSLLEEIKKHQETLPNRLKREGQDERYIPVFFRATSLFDLSTEYLKKEEISIIHSICEKLEKNNRYYEYIKALPKQDSSAISDDKLNTKEHEENISNLGTQLQEIITMLS